MSFRPTRHHHCKTVSLRKRKKQRTDPNMHSSVFNLFVETDTQSFKEEG